MKSILYLAALAILLASCQKPARDNPWDDKASLNPNDWAPQNLQVEDVTITEKKLSWTFDDKNIEGFKLDRKKGDEPWQLDYQVFQKEGRNWNDTDIIPNPQLNYQYRLFAFAGSKSSAQKSVKVNAAIPASENLQFTQNSITSTTLYWQDKSSGEEGFRLERKQGTGNWEVITTLPGTSYTDESFTLNTNVFYRVSAYYGQYFSDFIENSFNSQIPPPENLRITTNSATSVTLNWSYNLTGHEGFKVERKIDNGNWGMLAENLNPELNSFMDDGLDLWQHDYTYRIVAFIGEVQSNYTNELLVTQYIPSIGDIFAGGIVFYLDGNGGGLVCAENDQSTTGKKWGCYGTSIVGTATGIGTGAANTAAIVSGCSESDIAARMCNDLVLNGYSDWFLPSTDELNLMYQNLKLSGIGGFPDGYYWSSSEYSSNNAWFQIFASGGGQVYDVKNSYHCVRAVRAF